MNWLVRVTAMVALCAGSVEAQRSTPIHRAQIIVGIVTDTAGSPMADVTVGLSVSGKYVDAAQTNETGRFRFTKDVTGPAQLALRRLGFHASDIALQFPRDSARMLRITLRPIRPIELAEVAVVDRAPEVAGWLNEFETRRRTNSFGHFYDREALKTAIANQPSEVLRMIPSVQLVAARRGGYAVRIRGCRYAPIVWLDGMRAPKSELDEVVNLQDIAAMEVYTSTAGVPAQFMDRSNSGCGTILVWTRHQ